MVVINDNCPRLSDAGVMQDLRQLQVLTVLYGVTRGWWLPGSLMGASAGGGRWKVSIYIHTHILAINTRSRTGHQERVKSREEV